MCWLQSGSFDLDLGQWPQLKEIYPLVTGNLFCQIWASDISSHQSNGPDSLGVQTDEQTDEWKVIEIERWNVMITDTTSP